MNCLSDVILAHLGNDVVFASLAIKDHLEIFGLGSHAVK
jgi:hypothetical protein